MIENCDGFGGSAAPRIDGGEARGDDGIHRPNLLFATQRQHSLEQVGGPFELPALHKELANNRMDHRPAIRVPEFVRDPRPHIEVRRCLVEISRFDQGAGKKRSD